MGILWVLVLIFFIPHLLAGWSSNVQIKQMNSKYDWNTKRTDAEIRKGVAESMGYKYNNDGTIDFTRYPDGSVRRDKNGTIYEKGTKFD